MSSHSPNELSKKAAGIAGRCQWIGPLMVGAGSTYHCLLVSFDVQDCSSRIWADGPKRRAMSWKRGLKPRTYQHHWSAHVRRARSQYDSRPGLPSKQMTWGYFPEVKRLHSDWLTPCHGWPCHGWFWIIIWIYIYIHTHIYIYIHMYIWNMCANNVSLTLIDMSKSPKQL